MSSSRRLALLLALGFAAATTVLAQSSTSSSNPAADQAQAPVQGEQSAGQVSVQARIKARRAQRRAAAIREAYAHRYDAYVGMGYLRFVPGPGVPPGPGLEHAHEYAWSAGFTRYLDERLGVTAEARGYYATAYVYLQPNNPNIIQGITNPAISQYAALAGPTYRFYLQPKFSVSGRVLGGMDYGKFSGDLAGGSPAVYGLWPNGYTFAISTSIPVEYNVTPRVALRVAPEYFFSGFGSTIQHTRGFTTGIVYRFGKQ